MTLQERVEMAKNVHTIEEILEIFVEDGELEVIEAVIENPAVPTVILEKIAKGLTRTDAKLAVAILKNPNISETAILEVKNKGYCTSEVISALIRATTNEELIRELKEFYDGQIFYASIREKEYPYVHYNPGDFHYDYWKPIDIKHVMDAFVEVASRTTTSDKWLNSVAKTLNGHEDELAIAIIKNPNASCETLKAIIEVEFCYFAIYEEIAKKTSNWYCANMLCRFLEGNVFDWYEAEWEKVRSALITGSFKKELDAAIYTNEISDTMYDISDIHPSALNYPGRLED